LIGRVVGELIGGGRVAVRLPRPAHDVPHRVIRVVELRQRRAVRILVVNRLQPVVARVAEVAVGAGLAVGIRHPGQPAAVAHVRVAKAAEHIRDARHAPEGVVRGGLRDGVDRARRHAPELVVRVRDRVVRQRPVDRGELAGAELAAADRVVAVRRRPRPIRHRRQPGVVRS